MVKNSTSTLSIALGFLCALSLIACGRSPKTTDLSATEEPAQPTLPRAVTETVSTREAHSNVAVLTRRIGFRFDDASLSSEARAALTEKATVLRASPGTRLRLEGHADEQGTNEYNKALGMRRALSAKRYLVRRGVDPQLLYVISYGEQRPLDRGHSEAAWSANRRVEFAIMNPPVVSGR